MSEFRRVVSVCELQDMGVWKVTAARVLRFIDSQEYLLVCPDAQISQFAEITPSAWRIVGDDSMAGPYDFKKVEASVKGFNKANVGHLFQQFLKLNALIDPALADEDKVLVWDADTVPLRKIRFEDPRSGTMHYYHGVEYHEAYFTTIRKLTGLERRVQRSFIAQCFPTKVLWAREVVKAMAGSEPFYVQRVLDNLPGADPKSQEFSEYETMGTWNFTKYPGLVSLDRRNRWSRHGARWVGSDLKGFLTWFWLWLFSLRFDFVAFEKWEERLSMGRLGLMAMKKLGRSLMGRSQA